MVVPTDVFKVLAPLFSTLNIAYEQMPEPRPCPSTSSFEWGIPLHGILVDLPARPPEFEAWALESGYLNFSFSEQWYLNWLETDWDCPQVLVEGHLRDATVAARLREPRKGLRLFLKRLEYLPEPDLSETDKTKLLPAERKVLVHQQALVGLLLRRKIAWPAELLGTALESYRTALVRFWENECLDVEGDPGRTTLRTMIWSRQRYFLIQLLPSLVP